jgi:hypothetical protein
MEERRRKDDDPPSRPDSSLDSDDSLEEEKTTGRGKWQTTAGEVLRLSLPVAGDERGRRRWYRRDG